MGKTAQFGSLGNAYSWKWEEPVKGESKVAMHVNPEYEEEDMLKAVQTVLRAAKEARGIFRAVVTLPIFRRMRYWKEVKESEEATILVEIPKGQFKFEPESRLRGVNYDSGFANWGVAFVLVSNAEARGDPIPDTFEAELKEYLVANARVGGRVESLEVKVDERQKRKEWRPRRSWEGDESREVYVDGSEIAGKAGLGVYYGSTDRNYARRVRGIQTNAGAELEAIEEALKRSERGENLCICSDSLGSLEALEGWLSPYRQGVMKEGMRYRGVMRRIMKAIAEKCKEDKILFCKVKAHVGVFGNEEADKLAKQGTLMEEEEEVGIVCIEGKWVRHDIKNRLKKAGDRFRKGKLEEEWRSRQPEKELCVKYSYGFWNDSKLTDNEKLKIWKARNNLYPTKRWL